MKKTALIVDDNADYVKMILSHLEPHGYQFDIARNAAEGYKTFDDMGAGYYELIVTDITMEGQTAGLRLIRQIRSYGYKGTILVASTGFDNPLVIWLTGWFMKWLGVDLLVPKKPLKKGLFKTTLLSRKGKQFRASLSANSS